MTLRAQPEETSSRIDLLDKVTGQARYIEDLPTRADTLYATTIRSPYPHARILSIDASEAERLPGVLAIIHARNLDAFGITAPKPAPGKESFFASDAVRFPGDAIGMVAAVDLRTARAAAELVDVEYEPLPSIFSIEEALAPEAPLIHEELGTNTALEYGLEWGDVEQAFRDADRIVETSFSAPMVSPHPMEPARSFSVSWKDSGVDLWFPTNSPFGSRKNVAELFGIPLEQVRVQVPYIGGGFGVKDNAMVLPATAISRQLGRPVQVVVSDEEGFLVSARSGVEYRARVGVQNDGTLLAMDVSILLDGGGYSGPATHTVTNNATTSAWGAYRMPHFRVRSRMVFTNKVPHYMFRNTGKNETVYGVERTIDAVARQIEMSPLEFRARNMPNRGEQVDTAWKRENWRDGGMKIVKPDYPPLDTDLVDIMRRATEAIGWDEPFPKPSSPSVVRGRGVAVSLRRGSSPFGGANAASARATMDRAGRVHISHNAPEVGMGTHTMVSVVAAKTLGIPQGHVSVSMPDTDNNLPFVGVNSQRTTVQMGKAVQGACESLKRAIAGAAARAWGGRPEAWKVEAGVATQGEESRSYAEVASKLPGSELLEGVVIADIRPTSGQAYGGRVEYWAPGAVAVAVEVDKETGEVRILDMAVVADAGKAIHYPSARGQIEGGAIMGVGMGLFEILEYGDDALLSGRTFQYRLPLFSDLPSPERFHAALIENEDGPGPFGSKGIAQTTIGCGAPAIGNAIQDALGVELDSLPYTPEKILRALAVLPSDAGMS